VPHEVLMPVLSDEVDEGIVVTWFVTPGAEVREGQLIAEVQVEKVSSEVDAPVDGRVAELLVPAGGAVRQREPIALIADPSEAVASEGPAAPVAAAAAEAATPASAPAPSAPAPASPAARRVARELGVDLATVTGSGPGGRIVEEDVRRAAASGGAAAAAGPSSNGDGRVEALTPMRRAIARRLVAAATETAQLTLTAEADVTDLGALVKATPGASYTEAIVRACALSLGRHPRLGARLTDAGRVLPSLLDIGVAVAVEDGLVVPVVREADRKDVAAIGREIRELATRARAGQLSEADTAGGVFTVTNLGAHRIDAFTPLLEPGQTAILGVGRARPRPAAVDGQVAVRTLVALSLTFDHRVVDGEPAAAFLDDVIALLEDPDRLR